MITAGVAARAEVRTDPGDLGEGWVGHVSVLGAHVLARLVGPGIDGQPGIVQGLERVDQGGADGVVVAVPLVAEDGMHVHAVVHEPDHRVVRAAGEHAGAQRRREHRRGRGRVHLGEADGHTKAEGVRELPPSVHVASVDEITLRDRRARRGDHGGRGFQIRQEPIVDGFLGVVGHGHVRGAVSAQSAWE